MRCVGPLQHRYSLAELADLFGKFGKGWDGLPFVEVSADERAASDPTNYVPFFLQEFQGIAGCLLSYSVLRCQFWDRWNLAARSISPVCDITFDRIGHLDRWPTSVVGVE